MKPQRLDKLNASFHKRKNAGETAASEKGDGGKPNNGRWALKNLYPGLKSRELQKDQAEIQELLETFLILYGDEKLEDLPSAQLAEALESYEEIFNKKSLIESYAALLVSDNAKNYERVKPLEAWVGAINAQLSPFIEQLAEMKEDKLLYKLSSPKMSKYAPWLADLRAEDGHGNMPDQISKLSNVFDNVHAEGLIAFYQKQSLALEDKIYNIVEDTPEETRKAQADMLKKHSARFATVFNTLIKTRDVDRKWSDHKRQDQDFLKRNKLEPETADMIFNSVKKSYISLSQRYYKWLAEQHGEKVLPAHKLLDPRPGREETGALDVPWEDAEAIVLSAFRKFSPKFANTAKTFFDGNYIDAFPRTGKDTGGFSYPTGPEGHPFILMNYYDDLDSLVVLAHELGHGIHMMMSEEEQGGLLSETQETLAETASVFAEILLFDYLRGKTKDPEVKQELLEQQIGGLLDSAMLQMAYYDFEKRIYKINQTREPNAEEISDVWVDILQDYYGPSVEIDDYQRHSWCLLSHFFEMPSFYVFSYSFAQGMVNSLYKIYQETDDKAEFVQNYSNILKAGMSTDLSELLQPFGLDHTSEEFWQKGLELIEDYLNELEDQDPPSIPANAPTVADSIKANSQNGRHNKKNTRFKP